jgi:hypothetical protein
MRTLFTLLAFALVVGNSSAQTTAWPATLTSTGGVTFTRDTGFSSGTSHQAKYIYSGSPNSGLPKHGYSFFTTNGLSPSAYAEISDSVSGPSNVTLTYTGVEIWGRNHSWNGSFTWGSAELVAAAAPATYGARFHLPANSSVPGADPASPAIAYKFFQLGAQIGSTVTTYPGDAAQYVTVDMLDTADPVSWQAFLRKSVYVESTGTFVAKYTPLGDVSSGTVPTTGTPVTIEVPVQNAGTAAPFEVEDLDIPSTITHVDDPTPTTAPAAPTAGTTVAAPSTIAQNTSGDITDTGTVRVQDIHNAANTIINSVDVLNKQSVDNTNAMIHVIDGLNTYNATAYAKLLQAQNTHAQLTATGTNKVVDAINATNAAVTNGSNQVTTAINKLALQNHNISGGGGASASTSGDAIAGNAGQATARANAETAAATAAASTQTAIGSVTVAHPASLASAGSDYQFGPDIVAFGTTFRLRPFAFMPSLATWAGYIREFLLFASALAFWLWGVNEFKGYYQAFYLTPSSTQVIGPENAVPLAGVLKQVARAVAINSAMLIAVGVVIAALNTNLSFGLSGSSITSMGTVSKNAFDLALDRVGSVATLFNLFVPITAEIEFLIASLIVRWQMPAYCATAMQLAKYMP